MGYKTLIGLILILNLGTGCTGISNATIIPTITMPTVVSSRSPSSGTVMASGEVVPARQIDLGFANSGIIKEVNVTEGDEVKTDQILATQENISQLEAVVRANEQVLIAAKKSQSDLLTDAPLTLANAQLALVKAQKQYDDAVKSRKKKDYSRCDKDTIDYYYRILGDAQRRLNDLENKNDASTTHMEQIAQAKTDVNVAEANYVYCLKYKDQEVAESEADLVVADATIKQAKTRYELLKTGNGIDPDEAARLKAAVVSAEAQLELVKNDLQRAVIKAPFPGVIILVDVEPGKAVIPGQPIISIASLDNLQVETTDLSERDIPRVQVGQKAIVIIDALGAEINGKVSQIALKSTKVGGDVVFKVTITLDEQSANLRWGMSARVEISPE